MTQTPGHLDGGTAEAARVTLRSVALSLPGLRSMLGLWLLLGWVLLPGHRDQVVQVLAVALVLLAVAEVAAALGLLSGGRLPGLARALAPAAGAAVLLVGGDADTSRLAPAAGTILLVRGAADLLAAVRVGREVGARPWLVGFGAAQVVVGLASVSLTALFGQAAIVLLGFAWLAGGPATFLVEPNRRAGPHTTAPVPRAGRMSAEDRARLAADVFFDGASLRGRMVRYVVLLTVATVIATYGVLDGSVAAVIGAMIVAPLMMPIQSLAVSIVAGAARHARTSVLVLVGGVLLVLVLSTFIASTFRDLDVVLQDDQVRSRVSPALTDLAIAVAAGAAGGFSLLRKDVADSLPGVAVAVSLVPPLCVSGSLLAGGDLQEAAGAFLLFAVNFVAIVVATAGVLLLGGFGSPDPGAGRPLLTVGVGFGLALVVMAVPLGVTGLDTLQRENLESTVRLELDGWLGTDQPAEVLDLTVDGDRVAVLLASVERPPSSATLEDAVSEAVGRPVSVDVQWLQAESLAGADPR
jgi:uncharacterized hydrophobic protein (TIGR00271 family)